MRNNRICRAMVVLGLVVAAAACGSADDDGDGVASLGDGAAAGEVTDDNTGGGGEGDTGEAEPSPEEAFLEYAACMRGEGIDMPDPEYVDGGDGTGGIVVSRRNEGDAGEQEPLVDPDSDEFQAAEAECSPILEAVVGEIEIDPEQQAENREQMLAFSECMREHGVDYPDPEFGSDGRVTMSVEMGGQDPDDFAAAQAACDEQLGLPGGGLAAAPPIDGEGG